MSTKDSLLKTLEKQKVSKKVIDVISDIDKETFFDPIFKDKIYDPEPIPIGSGQQSDDHIIMAKMIDILSPKKSWNILEIGTGSGYSTSILASLVSHVTTIDFHEALALKAKKKITDQGYDNIKFYAGEATDYIYELGKFDGIIIFCGCLHSPIKLLDILNNNGTAVYPMGPAHQQQITSFTKNVETDFSVNDFKFHDFCTFNSIRGQYGWEDRIQGYHVEEANV